MLQEIDQERAQRFARWLLDLYTGGMLSLLIDIGFKAGLFEAAAHSPGTSHEIAARAGLNELYVREWLAAMTAGGIFAYDGIRDTYSLPPEHALSLTGDTTRNLAPTSQFLAYLGKHLSKVARAFRHGGGIPYTEFQPEVTDLIEDLVRRTYDERLIGSYLPLVPGLSERLAQGIRVLDIGCGNGHCVNLMAREYPASSFVGYDSAEGAIAQAKAEAEAWGLANVRFSVLDITRLPAQPTFDLIMAFHAVADVLLPTAVLRRVKDALAPGGIFLMIEDNAPGTLEENMSNPDAPFTYGINILFILPVARFYGGQLDTVWGGPVVQRLLADAGFTHVEVFETPRPPDRADAPRPVSSIYVCRT